MYCCIFIEKKLLGANSIDNSKEFLYLVREAKQKFLPDLWIDSNFNELSDYYYCIKKLTYYEKPNYMLLKKIFHFAIIKNEQNKNDGAKCDWGKKLNEFNKVNKALNGNKFIDKNITSLFSGYPEKLIWSYINQYKQ